MPLISLVLAIASPLATADDFVFARPAHSNAIHGVVMGDSGDYGAMRYEDFAWLNEALQERLWLVDRHTRSNEFVRTMEIAATNPVLKSVAIGAIRPDLTRAEAGHFLAPDLQPITSPRLMISGYGSLLTGKVLRVSTDFSTNLYHFATNVFVQTMTNGAQDVFVDAVRTAFRSNVLDRVTVSTNPVDWVDYCFPTQVYTLAESQLFEDRRVRNDIWSKRSMTNIFALVRAARRTVPESASVNIPCATNQVYTDYSALWGYPPRTRTEYERGDDYSVRFVREIRYKHYQFLDGDEWQDEDGYPRTEDDFYRTTFVPMFLELELEVNMADVIATYRAQTPRVEKALAFAECLTSASIIQQAYHSTAQGTETDVNWYTNHHSLVMIPLGEATRKSGGNNGRLTFSITVPTTIYEQAANFSDVPFFPPDHTPGVPSASSPSWYQYDRSHRSQNTYRKTEIEMSSSFNIYIIVQLNPTTKLSTWSEYQ